MVIIGNYYPGVNVKNPTGQVLRTAGFAGVDVLALDVFQFVVSGLYFVNVVDNWLNFEESNPTRRDIFREAEARNADSGGVDDCFRDWTEREAMNLSARKPELLQRNNRRLVAPRRSSVAPKK